MKRRLTARGEKQARLMGAWIRQQQPKDLRIIVSPALRTQQTAAALERKFKTVEDLSPGASAAAVLAAANWPESREPVLVVGHQPALGQTVAQLLGLPGGDCAVKKGAVWWLRRRRAQARPV